MFPLPVRNVVFLCAIPSVCFAHGVSAAAAQGVALLNALVALLAIFSIRRAQRLWPVVAGLGLVSFFFPPMGALLPMIVVTAIAPLRPGEKRRRATLAWLLSGVAGSVLYVAVWWKLAGTYY